MVQDNGYTKPANAVVVANGPDNWEVLQVKTAANMYPGRLVIRDTSDDQISVCGAGGKAIGWLGYEQTPKKYRQPVGTETVASIYLVNARVAVLSKPGMILMASVPTGVTYVKGDRLVAGANGQVALALAAAVPNSSTPVTSTSAQPTMAGPLSTQGIVIAIAEESATSSGDTPIMVRSLI